LGNEILSDDRFGAVVASALSETDHDQAEIVFAPVAGFALLDLLVDRERVLIVDTIQTGNFPPGTLHRFEAAELAPSNHLTTSHQISLPTALELGRQMGLNMPAAVDVIAVEAQDVHTLSEDVSPAVRAAVDRAVKEIQQWISREKTVCNGTNGKAAKVLAVGSA
jgi:hydrogenase maturation protease